MIAGLGALEAIGEAASGTVLAVFGRAAYLRFPGGLVALTAPGVAPGPVHLSTGLPLPDLQVDGTFHLPARWRQTATVWRGAHPDPDAVDLGVLAAVARGSALLCEPWIGRWHAATAGASATADLALACRRLGGLGPGLTPSGDDALAGMLLAAHLRRPQRQDDLVALAERVATHDISRAFLRWAARGQSIEPVHRLLGGDSAAAGDLLAFGHTSGADLALGLLAGLGVTPGW